MIESNTILEVTNDKWVNHFVINFKNIVIVLDTCYHFWNNPHYIHFNLW